MKYFLSIDGGGTKTFYLLCDQQGRSLAGAFLATTHYLQCGLVKLTDNLNEGIASVCRSAKIDPQQITAAFFAAAGYGDIPADEVKIKNAAQQAFGDIPWQIGNDCENALIGSLAGQPGINIVAGTGSIGLGIDETARLFRSGGWHHIYGGDEGSAYWLACRLIQEFTKQADGRKPKTLLYDYLRKTYDFTFDSDILVRCIEEWGFQREKIAAMAVDVYNCALNGDPFCLDLYSLAAAELAEIISAIKTELAFKLPIKVSYSGGVFNSGKLILKPLESLLPKTDYLLCEPLLSPAAGGIILAMRLAGLTPTESILNKLKEAT